MFNLNRGIRHKYSNSHRAYDKAQNLQYGLRQLAERGGVELSQRDKKGISTQLHSTLFVLHLAHNPAVQSDLRQERRQSLLNNEKLKETK